MKHKKQKEKYEQKERRTRRQKKKRRKRKREKRVLHINPSIPNFKPHITLSYITQKHIAFQLT